MERYIQGNKHQEEKKEVEESSGNETSKQEDEVFGSRIAD